MSGLPLLELMSAPPSYPDGVPLNVCQQFERLALEVRNVGYDRYSADAILHRIRWHERIERGNRAFRCNDHWTAPLARWFLQIHPEAKGFFELRERVDE
ncbi:MULTISPECIES: hypothetical protein [unclassified Bradyrhizobium]|uniref:hypothetical protein n=1 Tax=unclassified Bradyrhizobium TaxID=2631580 RepID=UPI001BAD8007|nr:MULTISPECIES: hypothetical protein [unclassified Bradyrhizobium]MBR1206596.1 hypothetical protein [Bradyrhizobium sp. AUGA SZCCT0124]MBR1315426.1 hypothetical protein [Bradyrhizobium sp. AUGA SZCCT0051]MBR1338512.1 hypothetical protein [Bradyrhizobium sp. AUGA SZCCT0105]MBR1356167.1 hypothetical protein [Bradyrhizobium sp. AUGA SZCCT0045]